MYKIQIPVESAAADEQNLKMNYYGTYILFYFSHETYFSALTFIKQLPYFLLLILQVLSEYLELPRMNIVAFDLIFASNFDYVIVLKTGHFWG